MARPIRLSVRTQADVERARRAARSVAVATGFDGMEIEEIVLAVSELATNLVRYAENGELTVRGVDDRTPRGVQIESRDSGPGITDLAFAMQEGASTGSGLGGGLPGVRRLMDRFDIATGPEGTTIIACKWLIL